MRTHAVSQYTPLAIGAALALLSPAALAQVNSMTATATYSMDGGPSTTLTSSYPSLTYVDVLDFSNSATSGTGLHSYGSTSGNFGSRASGTGTYQVQSSFNIIESFTNTGPTAQTGTFHFSITPGILQNTINTPLTGGSYVEAGLSFDIKRDGNSIWGSGATLKTDASGTAYNSSGDNTLYAGGGMMYNVLGGSHDIDLGVINAGQTIQLSYTLSTYANGDAPAGPPALVPAQTFVVPEGWYMEGPCKDGGYGGYGNLCAQHHPGDVVVIPEHWLSGNPGGSQASSGDPFHVDLAGTDYLVNHYGQNYQGYVSLAAVPEPNQYAMLFGGLGILAWLGQRRRRPAETASR